MSNKWLETTLEEACIVVTDGAHNSPQSVDVGLPMASVKDLTPYGITIETCRLISEDDFQKLVKWGSKPQKGDVLIAKDGATALDTVCEIRNDINVVLLSSVAILRPNPNIIIPSYLRYYLDSPTTRSYMKGSFITGAAIPRVVLKDFKRVKIRIPSIDTQRRIADILSAYDDLIENNTRRIRILEQMAQAIYQEWFGKVDKESLPKGWNSGIIRDFCDSYNYGYTAKAQKGQDGIKYLRITDIVPDHIDWENVPSCEIDEADIDKYLLKEGDIVVARTGATTGYAKRLAKRHPKSIFASYLVRFRIQPDISNHLIGLIVESDEYKQFIQANLGGAAQPMANAQVLTSFPLVIPPHELQEKFDSQVQPLFELKEILQIKNANLRQTRDLLLPRLVSGEVEV